MSCKPPGLLFLGPVRNPRRIQPAFCGGGQEMENLHAQGNLFRGRHRWISPFSRWAKADVRQVRRRENSVERNRAPRKSQAPPPCLAKLLVKSFVPPSVIINPQGDINYIHGPHGRLPRNHPSGQPRLNLLEMAREGLRFELAAAVRRAVTQEAGGNRAATKSVRVKTPAGISPG